jgi:hypothetical protein
VVHLWDHEVDYEVETLDFDHFIFAFDDQPNKKVDYNKKKCIGGLTITSGREFHLKKNKNFLCYSNDHKSFYRDHLCNNEEEIDSIKMYYATAEILIMERIMSYKIISHFQYFPHELLKKNIYMICKMLKTIVKEEMNRDGDPGRQYEGMTPTELQEKFTEAIQLKNISELGLGNILQIIPFCSKNIKYDIFTRRVNVIKDGKPLITERITKNMATREIIIIESDSDESYNSQIKQE